MLNGYVIGAFGGHCDLFNYTGMLVSISTQPWVGVASIFAMESSPGAPVQSDIMVQKGGKAGIWSGGMGIATDNGRIYVVTGQVSLGNTTSARAFADNCTEMASVMPTAMLQRLVEHLCLLSMKSLQISEYLRTVRSLSRIISSHMSTSLWMLVTETWAPRVSRFSILQLSKEQVSQEWQ
jgi:hypothetical protein